MKIRHHFLNCAQIRRILFSVGFVSSLYVWRSTLNKSRDDPSVIIRRFISIGVWSFISPLIVAYWAVPSEHGQSIWIWLGLRVSTNGLLQVMILPLMLTMILFVGPLFVWILSIRAGQHVEFFAPHPNDRLIQLRNIIVVRQKFDPLICV